MSALHEHRGALTTRAALASVAMALFLLVLKIYAALATGSVAMLGSLADTGLDLIASLVTLFAVRVAAMPADREHRFGHGKAEALAAMAQVVLISISAIGIGWQAVDRLVNGEATANAGYGVAVSVVAILATLALVAYQRSVIRRTGSVAIRTDAVHYQSDLLLNLSVIVALVLDQYFGFTGADPIFGLAIALWLIWGAWRASSHALDQLMDREWPEEKRMRFLAVASSRPEAKGIHDLRTRSSGSHDFAQFHIWVDPGMTVAAAHDVVEAIEADLEAEFPGCEVLIHLDPEGQVDHPGDLLREVDETRESIPE
ncbi:MAG: ferrous-iron efflux pump FieF [Sphingomonadales bacterium]|nr:ferrous-iron efflux pump FieF [Sphingomonadales bacterium]MEA3044432.1 ferrous-iron efflux pump FieF [Sphingomonadales bacterium]